MESKAYRSILTGDLGFLIERGGKKLIRLDRPNQVMERAYVEADWVEESEHRPILPHYLTRIYFEAEKHLRIAISDNKGREMSWEFMRNDDRNAYRREIAEEDSELVAALLKAMATVLDPLSR